MLNRCAGLSNLAKEKPIEVRPAIHPSPCHAMSCYDASICYGEQQTLGPLPKTKPEISRLLRTKTHYCGVLTEQGEQG